MGNEIIEFIINDMSTLMSPVDVIVGAIISAIFMRHNTSVEELEKIKNARFSEVAEDLIKAGKMTYTEFYKTRNFLRIAKKS